MLELITAVGRRNWDERNLECHPQNFAGGGLEFNAQHKVSPWGGLGGGQNGNALERRCWEALEAPGDVPAVT